MGDSLIIVGNGFDLHHNLKTSYVEYRRFLIKNGHTDIVESFEESIEEDSRHQSEVDYWWNRVEEVVGLLSYEYAYPLLKPYTDDKWSDSYHHDFQYEVEKMAGYWPGLSDYLPDWINSIEYTEPDEKLWKLISDNNAFISFNYTNTLEILYGIDKKNVCYIHGDASVGQKLILGHRNESYYPEWDDNNPDEDIRLLNAGAFMEEFRKRTYKPIEKIISENIRFNEIINKVQYNCIYMMGLSYNKTDEEYIRYIQERQRAHWILLYFSEEDLKAIPRYAKRVGISDYEISTYGELGEVYGG